MKEICKRAVAAFLAALLLITAGCVSAQTDPEETRVAGTEITLGTETVGTAETYETVPPTSEQTLPTQVTEVTAPPTETAAPEKYLVVIDPGHQAKGNYEKEPLGPGSDTMKAKVSSGTKGKYTKLWEYELNLTVSLLLRDILLERGYEVVMIRTTHDVNISNAERAAVANELGADVFIRVHANGSDNRETNGMMTLCQTDENPYNAHLYKASRLLAGLVLDEMVSITGANRRRVWETDTMTGINWCQVPVTIVEMGYMSNEKEDRLLATAEYQQKVAEGIANGIDKYFAALDEEASG